ncbi:Lee1p PWA37_000938 [Arxiozyma heterogenica]|uniref:C3H1-type domain-containing protein n=1 Tax=Arxiozyma heterogenica TaxID=278026 RepID=A0AAN8A8M3_9SACH|nr:hypothetical protein RI543_002851 [Kazachstania heterogenica]
MNYDHQKINNYQYYYQKNNNNSNINNNKTNFTPEKKQVILEHLLITKKSTQQTKNYSHVPCKFFKQGKCTAGSSCPFSHSLDFNEANKKPCKYFKFGNCKFGNKCANSHILSNKYISSSASTSTFAANKTSFSSRKFENNSSANTTTTTFTTTNNNINQFLSSLPKNNETLTTNYTYEYPAYNQLISRSSIPFTPPPSSSSCSSSLSCSSLDSPNNIILKYFDSFHSTTNNYNYNYSENNTNIYTNTNTATNNINKNFTPIMFTKIEEEEENRAGLEDIDSNDCYLHYSSILNDLEKEEEELEEENEFIYQQPPFQSPTYIQYQHFKFDDL